MPIHKLFDVEHINKILLYMYILFDMEHINKILLYANSQIV